VRFFAVAVCFTLPLIAQDAREIIRRAVDLDHKNAEIARNYTYLQRQETRQLDGSGRDKKPPDIRTYDITLLEGSPYRRLVARNDQPLSSQEKEAEQFKLKSSIELRRKETPEQKERRIAEWKRKQEKQREPLKELPDAFDFRLVGEASLNGGDTYVIDATPKPGYKPKSTSTIFFPKVKARFWIAKANYQWVKMDMETMDTITFGGILVRLAKGGHLVLEQTLVNNEVWLPKMVHLQASARLFLVKGYHTEIRYNFSDYKKFQAESRIVSTGPQPASTASH
jgi:hypothetical protein